MVDLISIGDSDRAAVAHVGHFDGRRVSDSESGWSGTYSGDGSGVRGRVCQGGGWMSEGRSVSSIGDRGRIAHADVSLARAGERRVDGLGLRGHLSQIAVTAQYIVGRRSDGVGLNVRYRRDRQGGGHTNVASVGRGQDAGDHEELK